MSVYGVVVADGVAVVPVIVNFTDLVLLFTDTVYVPAVSVEQLASVG